MKRRIARHKRTLALLLTLCLLFTCLPLQAMSAGGTAEETDISNEVYIVDEDITKRGEYEKHFLCSDGTYRAVTHVLVNDPTRGYGIFAATMLKRADAVQGR